MTRGLSGQGVNVSFVLPKKLPGAQYDWMIVYDASEYAMSDPPGNPAGAEACLETVAKQQCALTRGYAAVPGAALCSSCFSELSGHLAHIGIYARGVLAVAERQSFSAIHAHEWMTFPAAILAREVAARQGRKVPFIAHVHATEIDRHDGATIYNIEKQGLQAADRIIAVSEHTKSVITTYYDIDPNKISVLHNGIEPRQPAVQPRHALKRRHKLVLFLGRVTYQKGPDYYVRVAKQVTDRYPKVKFLMVGSGDMQASMMEMAAAMDLTGKLLFNSWLRDHDTDKAYQMADVFVMPSVSEPFGLGPLEAIQNGTPVIVSKNSGVVEVVKNCVAVDFWDIEQMASAILKLLEDEKYAKDMVLRAQDEIKYLTWDRAVRKLLGIYDQAAKGVAHA
jgi:glycosyltransferase involved in cell wall biosynthesis